MAATERTPLTRPTDSPNYVEFSNVLRTRTTRVRHFQCCICATLLAVFMMVLVISVSYSVNHAIDDMNVTSPTESSPNLLQSAWTLPPSDNDNEDQAMAALTDNEWRSGLSAGHEAIKQRETADAEATPLMNPSPNSRHQFAVSTSVFAGQLALAGLAEIAATRTIEGSRLLLGEQSSIGAYFDGGWAPEGSCKEFANLICLRSKYRTFDGTCNHKKQLGSAFTPFRRSLPPEYSDGLNSPRKGKFGKPLPSAREISLRVHPPSPSSNPSFTVMLAVFGQFFDHDITATALSQGTNGSSLACCPPASGHPECFPVHVGPGDPVYDYTGNTCMEFVRSAPAPQCKIGPRQQLNQVSAFIDASAVYGATESAAKDLREGIGGRLEMQRTPDNRTLLPPSRNPNDGCNRVMENMRGRYCFASGDARANENLHLTTMHLLWARQHNRVANTLAKINPHWDDEKLYQESRRIVGAQIQHITYREFLPIVLGKSTMDKYNLKPLNSGYRDNYDLSVNPAIANEFAAAAFRFAHTLLPGLMKMTNAARGTSTWVELHKMLFNPYSLYSPDGVQDIVNSATTNVIQQTSTHVTSQLTRHMFEDPMANTSVPCGLDLVSLNIQRGRDHGLQGYPAWREYCGLSRPNDFTDLEDDLDTDALEQMSVLYSSVDDIDLYSGALAEIPKGDGLLGPTFTCLIADQFVRLQRGDRYWYETSQIPQAFTADQLQEVRKTSLARLICDCSDGVTQVQSEVMRAVGSDNPIVSCDKIPSLSLDKWTEESKPVLEMKPATSDWVGLKNMINETIQDIIYKINASKTAAAQDWINLHDYINKTFIDIRNEIAQLNDTIVETPMIRPKEKLADTELENNVKSFVAEALANTNDHILRLQDESTVSNDWVNFKHEINQSLDSAIQYFKTTVFVPGDTDWLVFKETVKDQFDQIKYQISTLRKAIITAKLNNKTTPLWTDLKMKMNNTAIGVADNEYGIESSENLSSDMASFKEYVNNSLVALQAGINDLQPKPDEEEIQTIKTDWLDFRDKINKSLSDAIKSNNQNKPLPGDPAWATFRNDIMNGFAEIRTQITTIKPIAIMKPARIVQTNTDLKAVNNKMNDFVDNIPSTKINPAGYENIRFVGSLNQTFSDIKKNIENMEMKSSVPKIDVADWISFKSQINDTIMHLIDTLKNQSSIDWDSLRTYMNDSFTQIKNDISSISMNKNLLVDNSSIDTAKSHTKGKSSATVTNMKSKSSKTESITTELIPVMPLPATSKVTNYKKSIAYTKNNLSDSKFYSNMSKLAGSTISTQLLGKINSSYAKSQSSMLEWMSYKQYVSNGLLELQNMVDIKKQEAFGSGATVLAWDYLCVSLYVVTTAIVTIN